MLRLHGVCILLLTLTLVACNEVSVQPIEPAEGFWSHLSYRETHTAASRDDAVLLVYATAVWCVPCQHMERTTWQAPAVAEWFESHGMAYKLDVDEESDIARDLRVRSMPTFIAYRGGTEVSRSMGYHSAEQLLEWLDDVRLGRVSASGGG